MSDFLTINELDNVAVALKDAAGVAVGHKKAVRAILAGEDIIKYGHVIGRATADIKEGEWVHTHNAATKLDENAAFEYRPSFKPLQRVSPETFSGFVREDGSVGVRNELWVIPTVGCVNDVCRAIAAKGGGFAFEHPYGCSQTGEDHETTKRLLAALVKHPNASGVLVVGLGCENNGVEAFKKAVGDYDEKRVKFLVCQEEEDETAAGLALMAQLRAYAATFVRTPVSADKLIIGMKCGGSDGLSGITANPCVGALCDMVTSRGGSAILTETPEMFGAETSLFARCADRAVFDKAAQMVADYKNYFALHGQTVYENPSPGNKKGGITTLEDKSLGCVQKGGRSVITDVLPYAGELKTKGLNLLYGPGNDLVSATALAAAGAQIILFTTGRGTPFGAPVPTLKIASSTALFDKKRAWIDFGAGPIADGEPLDITAARLWDFVLSVAGGRETKNEINGYRGIAIFKNGVTL